MVRFIFKRISYGLLVLFGVATFVFFLFNGVGDPVRMMTDQRADKETMEVMRKELGLDRGIGVQYVLYLNDLSPVSIHNPDVKSSLIYLDKEKYPEALHLFGIGGERALYFKAPYLRRSYVSKRRVSDVILDTLPDTAVLALASIIIAVVLGIFFGVFSAIYKDSFLDKVSLVISAFGMSLPSYFSGIILAWIFGFLLSDITGLDTVGTLYYYDSFEGKQLMLKNLILPAVTLGIRPLAIIMQLVRSSMLDVLSQDYIRTANAKGLSRIRVVMKHCLKNALNPVLTSVSGWFASLMAGAVLVEQVFDWNGIGVEFVEAVKNLDMPIVMGSVMFFALVFVSINAVVDIIYGILDPRIRIS